MLTWLALTLLMAPSLPVPPYLPTLHVALAQATIAVVARSPLEARDLYRLAWSESRWTPGAVSSAGACGTWQQQPRWVKTTCAQLRTSPAFAALTAVGTYRTMRRACGDAWHRCYSMGVSGARKAAPGGW